MNELDADNVVRWLNARGRLGGDGTAYAELLAWGVSNVVLRIRPSEGPDFVVKQSREQLRTAAAWFSRLDRIWREEAVLHLLGEILPVGTVPRVLFTDRADYVLAMEAIDADHVVWKGALLAGVVDVEVAHALGGLLARIHGESARRPELRTQFEDRTVFDELRIDPFYRFVAEGDPALRGPIRALLDEMDATRVALVLADFSPKNILLHSGGLTLVDFETGHWGDPAFDLGFFLSHLLLKMIHAPDRLREFRALVDRFCQAYFASPELAGLDQTMQRSHLERRTMAHLGACMLARVDGKSPVDYLTDSVSQQTARQYGTELLTHPPSGLAVAAEQLVHRLSDGKND